MTQLSEEQRELVSQIRERHLRVDCYKSQMRADIDLFLSLLDSDSQAATYRGRNGETIVTGQTNWWPWELDELMPVVWKAAKEPCRTYHAGCPSNQPVQSLWCSPCSAREAKAAVGERSGTEYLVASCLPDAATAMRDKCVEKVKAMGQQWYGEAKKRGAAFSDKGRLAETIAAELESLTLDPVKPGEM